MRPWARNGRRAGGMRPRRWRRRGRWRPPWGARLFCQYFRGNQRRAGDHEAELQLTVCLALCVLLWRHVCCRCWPRGSHPQPRQCTFCSLVLQAVGGGGAALQPRRGAICRRGAAHGGGRGGSSGRASARGAAPRGGCRRACAARLGGLPAASGMPGFTAAWAGFRYLLACLASLLHVPVSRC